MLSFSALYLGKTAVLIFSLFTAVIFLLLFLKHKKLFIKMTFSVFFLILAIGNAFYSMNVSKNTEALPEEITVKGVATESPIIYENGQS